MRRIKVIHKIKINENVVLFYNKFSQKFLFVKKNFLEKMGKQELKRILIENCILIKKSEFKKILRKLNEKNQFLPKVLLLFLTTRCNLNCKYCIIGEKVPRHDMNEKIMRRSISYFIENLIKNKVRNGTVIFYGGEPLVNKDIFLKSVDHINKLSKKFNLKIEKVLQTNGTLINDEIINFCEKNKVTVVVSLDGPRKINDKNRIFHDGSGTFKVVSKNIRKIKYHKIRFGISSVITESYILSPKSILNFIYKTFNPQTMGFDFLHPYEKNKKFYTYKNKYYLSKAWLEACELVLDKGFYIEHIVRHIRPLLFGCIKVKECPAYGSKLVVTPTGLCLPCEGLINVYRGVKFSQIKSSKLFVEWSKRIPFKISKCRKCIALTICGGSCAYNCLIKKRTIWSVDDSYCIALVKIMKFLFKKIYEKFHEKIEKRGYYSPTRKEILKIFPEKLVKKMKKFRPLKEVSEYEEIPIYECNRVDVKLDKSREI